MSLITIAAGCYNFEMVNLHISLVDGLYFSSPRSFSYALTLIRFTFFFPTPLLDVPTADCLDACFACNGYGYTRERPNNTGYLCRIPYVAHRDRLGIYGRLVRNLTDWVLLRIVIQVSYALPIARLAVFRMLGPPRYAHYPTPYVTLDWGIFGCCFA